jgi:hypothetical protein
MGMQQRTDIVAPEKVDSLTAAVRASLDPSSAAVVGSAMLVMSQLAMGTPPADAMEVMPQHLSGHQIDAVAVLITSLSPRGEEFRQWWKSRVRVDRDKVVHVEVLPLTDECTRYVFWSYGYRAAYFKKSKPETPVDLFMQMCSSAYASAEFGWRKMQIVSGPTRIGPNRFIFVFRPSYDGEGSEDLVAKMRKLLDAG